MTRKRVTASEKKQRHEWAVRQIDAGMGLSELTAFTAETWGCSRRQARDVVAAAHKDWLRQDQVSASGPQVFALLLSLSSFRAESELMQLVR